MGRVPCPNARARRPQRRLHCRGGADLPRPLEGRRPAGVAVRRRGCRRRRSCRACASQLASLPEGVSRPLPARCDNRLALAPVRPRRAVGDRPGHRPNVHRRRREPGAEDRCRCADRSFHRGREPRCADPGRRRPRGIDGLCGGAQIQLRVDRRAERHRAQRRQRGRRGREHHANPQPRGRRPRARRRTALSQLRIRPRRAADSPCRLDAGARGRFRPAPHADRARCSRPERLPRSARPVPGPARGSRRGAAGSVGRPLAPLLHRAARPRTSSPRSATASGRRSASTTGARRPAPSRPMSRRKFFAGRRPSGGRWTAFA